MSGNCPLCGAPLNLGLNFCVVCGRRSIGNESSKMVGLKAASRQSDLTQRIDLNDERFQKEGKKKTPLRFRKVRGLGSQIFYVVMGISLFFCAIRFALDPKSFHENVQRTVHAVVSKDPLKNVQDMLGLKPPPAPVKPPKPPAKKTKPKKKRTHSRRHTHAKPAQNP